MQSVEGAFLSPRQAEIAQLVAAGKSTREIAFALMLSPRTVETHIAAIYNKLGVSSRMELIVAILGSEARSSENATADAIAITTNLPAQRVALVGRATDVANLTNFIRDSRLVTITGAGGIGKTRAALAVGEALRADFTAGVWLVELASLARGSSVAGAVVRALGIESSSSASPIEALCVHLKRRSLLLVLDNCEHVVTEAAAVADALLRGCPLVRILATSREKLRIAGERAYRLPSLEVPPPADGVAIETARGKAYPSVELFTQRAQAVAFDFTLTAQTTAFVEDICRRVDGIPLAIELAAARVNVLPVTALATTIESHLRILGVGDRTASPRHQTMHALIDWSYDLLEPKEQRLFERLSVFTGSCALPEVVAVYSEESVDEIGVLDMLSSLVDKSLVVADATGPQPRYSLLQTFALYGREKLVARGDAAAVARRHAEAYTGLAERLEVEADNAPSASWYARAEREMGNWRTAMDWALEKRHDVVLGQRLVAALRPVLRTIEGAQRSLQLAQELIDEQTPTAVAAAVRYAALFMTLHYGRHDQTVAECRRLSAVYATLGEPLRVARIRAWEATALFLLGRIVEAEALLAQVLDVARKHAKAPLIAYALDVMAQLSFQRGDVVNGRARAAEAIATYESIGAERSAVVGRSNLADAEFGCGNIDRAVRLATSNLIAVRHVGLKIDIARALANLAGYCIAADRWAIARDYAREALKLMKDTQHYVLLDALLHIAAVAALAPSDTERPKRLLRAARLLSYADERSKNLGHTRQVNEEREYNRVRAALREVYSEDVLAIHLADGAALSADQAIELAMSM